MPLHAHSVYFHLTRKNSSSRGRMQIRPIRAAGPLLQDGPYGNRPYRRDPEKAMLSCIGAFQYNPDSPSLQSRQSEQRLHKMGKLSYLGVIASWSTDLAS